MPDVINKLTAIRHSFGGGVNGSLSFLFCTKEHLKSLITQRATKFFENFDDGDNVNEALTAAS